MLPAFNARAFRRNAYHLEKVLDISKGSRKIPAENAAVFRIELHGSAGNYTISRLIAAFADSSIKILMLMKKIL